MSKNKKTFKKKLSKTQAKEIKKFNYTYDWLDIKGVSGQYIILKDDTAVFGVKLIPPKIISEKDEVYWARKMATIYNSCQLPIYHQIIQSPIEVERHISDLNESMSSHNSEAINQIILDEIESYKTIASNLSKKEYLLMLKGNPLNSNFAKKVSDFLRLLLNSKIEFRELNEYDYENYFAYIFENDMVNDFYFSHNIYMDVIDYDKEIAKIMNEEGDNNV